MTAGELLRRCVPPTVQAVYAYTRDPAILAPLRASCERL